MKTQNMKLLDLQTGIYLELRKDFYYGGDAIMLHYYTEEELTDYEEIEIFSKYLIIPKRRFNGDYNDETQYKKTIKNGFDKAMHDGEAVHLWIEYKSEPPFELKEICEKVGAVVYGGRYVLLNGEQDTSLHDDNHFYKIGDVVFDDNYNRYGCVAICKSSTEYASYEDVVDIPEFIHNCEAGVMYRKYEIIGNIFEEYSKQLRNELNKFDELIQHFK